MEGHICSRGDRLGDGQQRRVDDEGRLSLVISRINIDHSRGDDGGIGKGEVTRQAGADDAGEGNNPSFPLSQVLYRPDKARNGSCIRNQDAAAGNPGDRDFGRNHIAYSYISGHLSLDIAEDQGVGNRIAWID